MSRKELFAGAIITLILTAMLNRILADIARIEEYL